VPMDGVPLRLAVPVLFGAPIRLSSMVDKELDLGS